MITDKCRPDPILAWRWAVVFCCLASRVSLDRASWLESFESSHELLFNAVCPIRCRCLDRGSIMACQKNRLTRIPIIIGTALMLDLDQNQIGLFPNGSFPSNARLEMISVQDNGLLHLESGAFLGLKELRILRLGRNHLSSLPRNIFISNRRLQVLDLHGNYFTSLPGDSMYHLHSLQTLNFSYNHLRSPKLGSGFRFTTQLSDIDLSGNEFSSVDSDAFALAHFWDKQTHRNLNLSFCGIKRLHRHAFFYIPSLSTLSLIGNPHISSQDLQEALTHIPQGNPNSLDISHMNISDASPIFGIYRPHNLVQLSLSNNRIQSLQMRTFSFMENLTILDVSHNDISVLEKLVGLPRLESLNLAYNSIYALESNVFDEMQELEVIDLSHNYLARLDDEIFLNLFNLHSLYVGHNQIEEIGLSDGLEGLEMLDVSWNRLTNARFLQRFRRLRSVDLSHNTITRLGEELFTRGLESAISVNLSSNVIREISPHAFQSGNFDTVDISANKLEHLENQGWRNIRRLIAWGNRIRNISGDVFKNVDSLQELQLQQNEITEVPVGVFSNLHKLKILDLSSNPVGAFIESTHLSRVTGVQKKLEVLKLKSIGLTVATPSMLEHMTSLRVLDLSGNRLKDIHWSCFSHQTKLKDLNLADNDLSQLVSDLPDQMLSLKSLDLSGNPLDCSCRLVTTYRRLLSADVLKSTNRSNRGSSYRCQTPERWAGVSLAEFYTRSSPCLTFPPRIVASVVMVSVVALVISTVFILTCLVKPWRRRKQQRLHRLVRYDNQDDNTASNSNNIGMRDEATIPIIMHSKL